MELLNFGIGMSMSVRIINVLGDKSAQTVKENYGQRVQENQESNVNKEIEIVKSNQIEILELEILTAALWAKLHPSNSPMLKP